MMQMDFYVISYLCTCIIVNKRKESEKANCCENETWYHHLSSVTVVCTVIQTLMYGLSCLMVFAVVPAQVCRHGWDNWLALKCLSLEHLSLGSFAWHCLNHFSDTSNLPMCSVNIVGSRAQSATLSTATARGSQGVSLQFTTSSPSLGLALSHLPLFLFSSVHSLCFPSLPFLCV